jgi:hypothetical protein
LSQVEQQNEFDLLQIVEDLLRYWEKPGSRWEGRRDGVLDLIGKATPGTFQPSLQIDGTGAKLLIEALSGRWSYGIRIAQSLGSPSFTIGNGH